MVVIVVALSETDDHSVAESEPTQIMVAVNESSIKGYPHGIHQQQRCIRLDTPKIICSNSSGLKLLFLHVQVPDDDGFNDMDVIYASPGDFHDRGLHLLECFVGRSHEIGVSCEA
ncbi:universal stress protein A-like protein [Macadamia integrifolia]|uniref:universal stress protein A-like protein n=1 Tax=Macadamia integrifolia TaxID=60698 RepID=UPI001C5007A7|nr:universal stress protein A-like protein [Macadamia integrifolia]